MPTSGALDRVAQKLNLPFYENEHVAIRCPLVGNFLEILWMLENCQFVGKKVLELVLITFVKKMAYGNYVLHLADDFNYADPVDGSIASKQGYWLCWATVRLYIEQFEPDVSKHNLDAQAALKPLIVLIVCGENMLFRDRYFRLEDIAKHNLFEVMVATGELQSKIYRLDKETFGYCASYWFIERWRAATILVPGHVMVVCLCPSPP
ncbi:hypothetical protein ACH5RR_019626 [Cinchona calisaya]|uniref:Uncharacterized protein n=1 Tax=Cinchona calisaya TaxID=153742 RepID=A0ABD2ZTG9_9GENT